SKNLQYLPGYFVVTYSYRLEIYNFTGSLIVLARSAARPGGAFGVSKAIKHSPVEPAQDMPHEVERAVVEEVRPVNCRAIDVRWEKAGAINVPHVVCW